MRLDPTTADCMVFTAKEGLLSAVAHDLQIRVSAFEIAIDETAWHVEAHFDAASLRVVGVMRDGVLHPDDLGPDEKRSIERSIVADVLHADRHPEIRFVSTVAAARGDALGVEGTLALHGQERPVAIAARRDERGWTGETRLHQPDFGIRPYRAMLGTLRVQPDVVVRVVVPSAYGANRRGGRVGTKAAQRLG
jgi:polyisoprenoid-binding protein YceI